VGEVNGNKLANANLLRPVDAKEFTKSLKLERAAERRSRADSAQREAIDAQFYDEAVSELRAVNNQTLQNFTEQARATRDYVNSLAAKLDFEPLHGEVQGRVIELKRDVDQERSELQNLHRLHREEDASYQRFRDERGLTRPPADPVNPGVYMIDLIILWFVESAINAVFLVPVSPSPAAGFINSVVISSVNVILALLIGYWITKRINHRHLFNKIVGFIHIPVVFCFFVGFHYFITQFRAQLEIAAEEERASSVIIEISQIELMSRTLDYIFENPFRVPDLLSAILFLIGLVLALYAWWKGYHLGDEYPGYTKRFKVREERRKAFQKYRKQVFDERQDIRDHAMQRIDTFILNIGPTMQVMQAQKVAWQGLIQKLSVFQSSCLDALDYALSKYVSEVCGGVRPEVFKQDLGSLFTHDISIYEREMVDINETVERASSTADASKAAASNYRQQVYDIIESSGAELKAAIGEMDA
jgi:hypothetical protein